MDRQSFEIIFKKPFVRREKVVVSQIRLGVRIIDIGDRDNTIYMIRKLKGAGLVVMPTIGAQRHAERARGAENLGEFQFLEFRLDAGGNRVKGDIRQEMADEIMYQLAALLPEKYRGVYADHPRLKQITEQHGKEA